jgi:hypothetical protein
VAAEAAGLIEVGVAEAVAREVDADPAQLWLTGLSAVLRSESHDPNRRGALTLCRAVLAALTGEHRKLLPAVRVQPEPNKETEMTANPRATALEAAAQAFAEATDNPPYLYDLSPVEGRKTVDEVQAGEIAKPDVDIEDTTLAEAPVRIVRPKGATGVLPVTVNPRRRLVFGNAPAVPAAGSVLPGDRRELRH